MKWDEMKEDDRSKKDAERLQTRLSHYQRAINEIDDYFEYRMESKLDQKYVHYVLANLTSNLSEQIEG